MRMRKIGVDHNTRPWSKFNSLSSYFTLVIMATLPAQKQWGSGLVSVLARW